MDSRDRFKQSEQYGTLKKIADVMDKWHLDSIIGLIPGAGDAITGVVVLPYLHCSLFVLHSIPLTLSIIYNTLVDVLIGIFPIGGDIFDFFHKSFITSYEQIIGYAEGNPQTLQEIDSGAVRMCILITVLCILIRLAALIVTWLISLIVGIFL